MHVPIKRSSLRKPRVTAHGNDIPVRRATLYNFIAGWLSTAWSHDLLDSLWFHFYSHVKARALVVADEQNKVSPWRCTWSIRGDEYFRWLLVLGVCKYARRRGRLSVKVCLYLGLSYRGEDGCLCFGRWCVYRVWRILSFFLGFVLIQGDL